MKKIVTLLAVTLGGLAVAACGPDYDRTEITNVLASPLGGSVDYRQINVHSGMVVKAKILPYNDSNERMSCRLRSLDPRVVDVLQVVNDGDFAFLGLAPGRTQIEVRADDRIILVLDAVVTEQPAP